MSEEKRLTALGKPFNLRPKKDGTTWKEPGKDLPKRRCDECGKWFQPAMVLQRFDTKECRKVFHNRIQRNVLKEATKKRLAEQDQ